MLYDWNVFENSRTNWVDQDASMIRSAEVQVTDKKIPNPLSHALPRALSGEKIPPTFLKFHCSLCLFPAKHEKLNMCSLTVCVMQLHGTPYKWTLTKGYLY
jgi:hypothetical protein